MAGSFLTRSAAHTLQMDWPTYAENEPCPCESGKTFKDCHGVVEREGVKLGRLTPKSPPPDTLRKMAAWARESVQREQRRRSQFGELRLPNAPEFPPGQRIVGVGGVLYQVDARHAPLNFMGQLLVNTLGQEWCAQQLARTDGTPHPIIEWYRDAMDWQQRHVVEDNRVRGILNGPAKAWFLLAFDMWVLQHHALLAPLLRRLRNPREFHGARYELTNYALFLRAGFDVERDPETDNRVGHVEFFATQRQTRERVEVEAKCRYRPGVLGFPAAGYNPTLNPQPNVTGVLRAALRKSTTGPYVVCIELNLPPTQSAEETQARFKAAQTEIDHLTQEYANNDEAFPITVVVLTNYPHHYGLPDAKDPPTDQVVIAPYRAEHPFAHQDTTDRLIAALDAYGYLPQSWDDFD
jgi:hypothetical protein